jgi:hypothetical protein
MDLHSVKVGASIQQSELGEAAHAKVEEVVPTSGLAALGYQLASSLSLPCT